MIKMRPTPIPDVEIWADAVSLTISAPDGAHAGDIRPVEMLVEDNQYVLEPGELEILQERGVIWVSSYGHVVPFSFTVAPRVKK